MIRRSAYPVEIAFKVDLNTDLLLTELQGLFNKDRSKVLRLIINDFFNRNLDLIDEHIENKGNSDLLVKSILKDFFDFNRSTINHYTRFKNEKGESTK